jgi:mono/diheme cytochrome c family protein
VIRVLGSAALWVAPIVFLCSALVAAGAPPLSYTADQAWHGRLVYFEHCAECHGGGLQGQIGPALAGPDARTQWETGQYIFEYTTAMMPHGDAGGLSSADYINVMAFLLQQHRFRAGSAPLTKADLEADTTVPLGR